MNVSKNIFLYILLFFVIGTIPAFASGENSEEGKVDIAGMITSHLGDSYGWHVFSIDDFHATIPLPVIVKGEESGWNIFLSSEFHHGESEYKGFYIAKTGKYAGKIVEKDATAQEVRPWDLSITKNAFALIFSSILLVVLILNVARWYKKNNAGEEPSNSPRGFMGFMEMFIMMIHDDLIVPCVGKNYRKFAPYLLTVFFFIFLNNLLGLIPLFPGGANVTGNLAVTFVLAIFTFLAVNLFGTKEYWKEVFWPEVPTWLKAPIPIMPAIELVSLLTKPFALMIRLFANILAGHSIVLGLMSLIFITASLGSALNVSLSFVSVLLTVFMDFVELLVAFIQAYVFTMLSAVFIGLAQVEPHTQKH